MKRALLLAFLLALPALALEVDIFKEKGDPRVVAFTVPAAQGDAPVKSFFLGLFVTALIQSSTATIVITAGLVAAGIIKFNKSQN